MMYIYIKLSPAINYDFGVWVLLKQIEEGNFLMAWDLKWLVKMNSSYHISNFLSYHQANLFLDREVKKFKGSEISTAKFSGVMIIFYIFIGI